MVAPITFHPRLVELLQSPNYKRGGSTVNNLQTLAQLLRETQPARTLEIGMGPGASALLFASYHQEAGHEPLSHTAIDPYQTAGFGSIGLNALKEAGLDSFVSFRGNFSALELPKLIEDGASFGLIYIDGSHLFENAFVDAYFCTSLLTEGGVMLFDDSSTAQILKVVRFQRGNMRAILEEVDLAAYRNGEANRYRLARALGRVQLTAFRRIGSQAARDESAWNDPLRRF
jgi:predicted O-methyltransferase YrrM